MPLPPLDEGDVVNVDGDDRQEVVVYASTDGCVRVRHEFEPARTVRHGCLFLLKNLMLKIALGSDETVVSH